MNGCILCETFLWGFRGDAGRVLYGYPVHLSNISMNIVYLELRPGLPLEQLPINASCYRLFHEFSYSFCIYQSEGQIYM